MSYALLAAYTLAAALPPLEDTRRRLIGESQYFVDQAEVTTRGWYDVSGFTAGTDLLVWWTDEDPERLQDAAHRLRSSALGHYLTPVWSTVVRGDLPSVPARDWLTVLPDADGTVAASEVTAEGATVTELDGRGLSGPRSLVLVEAAGLDAVVEAARTAGDGAARAASSGLTGVRVSPAEWAERQPRS